jgi:prepilin-type processing-associated H-X9-DG protein
MSDMSGYYNPATPTKVPFNRGDFIFFEDMPAFYHDKGAGLGFCDGHSEIHQWKDARTYPPLQPPPPSSQAPLVTGPAVNGLPLPYDNDVFWMQDHTVRPIGF